jgi:tetratricopeptide (TPR) repeat protein
MRLRLLLLALLCFGLVAAQPVAAQPVAGGPRAQQLDKMFARLQETKSDTEAQALSQAIWIVWTTPDDSNVADMMRRGLRAMSLKNLDEALELFDRMVKYAPDFAEGWNKRATVHFMLGDYEASVADIQKTLVLEPRHFGALSGLGMIYEELNRLPLAIKAYEEALKANPHLTTAKDQLRDLKKKLQGSPT